jgi:ketosteroid isomerase-like protein
MYTKYLVVTIAVALAATACLADHGHPPTDETKSVEEASARFYASLNAMFIGDAGPMKEVWSHADDVTYMGPGGGIQVGWNKVQPIWEAQAALMLGGEVQPTEMRVTVGNDLAFSQCFEKGSNRDAQGHEVKVSIRATNLFRKEGGAWKMIGHHTDILPFLEEPALINSLE